jgi:hypothetical protein
MRRCTGVNVTEGGAMSKRRVLITVLVAQSHAWFGLLE